MTPPAKKKPSVGCLIGLVLLALGVAYVGTCGYQVLSKVQQEARDIQIVTSRHERHSESIKQGFIGSDILDQYGLSFTSPQQDLTDLSHTLGNFALLVKGSDPLPLGANEDLADALRGKNRAQLRFLPADAPCFNPQGQLVDRWQTPLFFHANDQQRLDIRSAGPDKQMWTADDIHRRYDGQFIKGEALNSPSLFDATKDYRPQP